MCALFIFNYLLLRDIIQEKRRPFFFFSFEEEERTPSRPTHQSVGWSVGRVSTLPNCCVSVFSPSAPIGHKKEKAALKFNCPKG